MSQSGRDRLRRAAPYLVATAWLVLGWAFLVRGVEHPGVAYRPWAFRHHASSDLLAMTGDRYLAGGRPLPYLEDRVPQGVDPGTFDMRRQSGTDAYLQLPGVSTVTEFKVVRARTDRLGLFWNTSPAEASIRRRPPPALTTRRCGPWPDVSPTAIAASFLILSSPEDL